MNSIVSVVEQLELKAVLLYDGRKGPLGTEAGYLFANALSGAVDPRKTQMKRRLFTDAYVTPTEALLRKQLGSAMDYYSTIIGTSGDYRKQWQYSRGNGWILKVDDMRKALYYLIAFDEGIEISLTVRDEERAAFLKSRECEKLYPQLEAGTKYPEGYALRFEIESAAECKAVVQFLSELMKVRPVSTILTDKQKLKPNGKESKSKR